MSTPPRARTKQLVLFVDDDEDTRFLYRQYLETSAGYEVIEASDGRTAITLAASASPDVIVIDMTLPGADGVEVARALRENERTRAIPLIALTGRADMQGTPEAAGFRALLVKPCSAEALAARVESVLGR